MDGECVDAAGEFIRKRRIDHAMALQPALPSEGISHDIDAEVCLSFRPMPRMPRMVVGLVDHFEIGGCESLGQLSRDDIAPMHRFRIIHLSPKGNSFHRRLRMRDARAFDPCRFALRFS
jgi:hypothetical protein